jgi:ribosomal protein L37AE/L43A
MDGGVRFAFCRSAMSDTEDVHPSAPPCVRCGGQRVERMSERDGLIIWSCPVCGHIFGQRRPEKDSTSDSRTCLALAVPVIRRLSSTEISWKGRRCPTHRFPLEFRPNANGAILRAESTWKKSTRIIAVSAYTGDVMPAMRRGQ